LADLDSIITSFQRGEKDLIMREVNVDDVYYQQSIYCFSDRQFIYVYAIDITERKKAEMELLQSEKLSALGKFATGIAHEVRNPLGIVLGGIEFLEQRLIKGDKDVKIAIEKIKEATLRATGILGNLLKFSKPYEIKIERIPINSVIDEAVSLFKYSLPSKYMETSIELTKDDICVNVDKNRLQQAMFNILINAVEAMPKGGKITIRAHKTTIPPEKTPVCLIEIIDTGPGIPKENLEKIFEPFFTTKGKRGTGLGLTTAKMIVNNFKGDIKIDSVLGKGTNIKIILPVA
jgi:signal transduction histidine kinase